MKKTNENRRNLLFLVLSLALISVPISSFAQIAGVPEDHVISIDRSSKTLDSYESSATVSGIAVNGWNRIFGDPAVELRFVGPTEFAVGGVFNPGGPALEINNDTSPDALMASFAAPDVYLAFFGVPNAETVPNQNILYENYPHLVTHDSQQAPLPQLADNPEWWGKSNGARVKDLTVEQWLRAKGKVKFTCSSEGNHYSLTLRRMIPGGLYTVWGFYFDQESGQLQPDFAFGGTSANVFTANRKGFLHGNKDLSFCPLTVGEDERYQLVNLFVVFHPDGRVNASLGHTVATPPFNGPGMTATPQLMFAIPDFNFDN